MKALWCWPGGFNYYCSPYLNWNFISRKQIRIYAIIMFSINVIGKGVSGL